jgi:uncharacterized protein (DUF3820 family)
MSESNQKKVIFLREGAESKMFTMWKSFHIEGYGMKEQFLKNLSTDRDKAESLAMAYAEKFGCMYIDDARDYLRPIAKGEDVIRFGKHKDCRLSEVSEKYLLWIAQGCPIKELDTNMYSDTQGEMITVCKYFGGDDFQKVAQREAVAKGIGTIQEGRFYTVDYWNAILKKREARSLEKASEVWEHHYAEKTKVTLDLTFVKETSYDTCYGRTYIFTFKENATGRMFLYKGASNLNAEISYGYKGMSMGEIAEGSEKTWKSLVKGATYQVKGTVKLGDYKGIKQTFLQRLTISKDLGLLECSDLHSDELDNKIESAQAC